MCESHSAEIERLKAILLSLVTTGESLAETLLQSQQQVISLIGEVQRLQAENASRSDLVDRLGDECERLLAEVARYQMRARAAPEDK